MGDFETAVADSKKLTSKPSDTELLQLYGASSEEGEGEPDMSYHRRP
jgi:acyl-CoA-binding protein